MFIKRILMNEEGASPGGGTPTPAPASPPAEPGAPQPAAITVDQIKSVVTESVAELKNAIFADLRRSGALKQDKPADPKPAPTPAQPTASAPAPTGLSAADVEAMLERERVITRASLEYKLSDAQVKRTKAALSGVAADEYSTALQSYLADMGLNKATDPSPSNPNPAPAPVPTVPNLTPLSDKGSPAPGGVLDWEREFAENPIGMSPAARARMDAKHGEDKARKMRLEAAQRQAERIRVTKPTG